MAVFELGNSCSVNLRKKISQDLICSSYFDPIIFSNLFITIHAYKLFHRSLKWPGKEARTHLFMSSFARYTLSLIWHPTLTTGVLPFIGLVYMNLQIYITIRSQFSDRSGKCHRRALKAQVVAKFFFMC